MRILTLGGLAGPAVFASITILCAALRSDYSHVHQLISELGAADTPHAWLMNVGGFMPAGLLLVGFGASIKASLPRQRTASIGAWLICLFGGGVALSGLFSCDVGCPQAGGSIENLIHDRLAPLTFLAGSLGAVILGVGFRSLPMLRPVWIYSVASGLAGLGLLAAVASTLETRELTGLWQRLLLAVLFGWCAVVGFRLTRIGEVEPSGGSPSTSTSRIERIRTLLKGIETGDPDAVSVISPTRYIQHNPQTHSGREGLAELFARLSKTAPRVNIVRAFADGDFVFAHTEYDFASRRVGFEVFRFEGDLAVEHWDNIQPRLGPNPSGHSMVDGPTVATDFERTEVSRDLVRAFVESVRIAGNIDALDSFVCTNHYTEHHPSGVDGFASLKARLETTTRGPEATVYRHLHRVLAQGDFALAVSEGSRAGVHAAFYDLYRVEEGEIVEHWDTIEAVAPPEEWRHENGKF